MRELSITERKQIWSRVDAFKDAEAECLHRWPDFAFVLVPLKEEMRTIVTARWLRSDGSCELRAVSEAGSLERTKLMIAQHALFADEARSP
jgi:hypothetical protein